MQPDKELIRFVQGLVAGASGHRKDEQFVQADGRRASAEAVATLIASGAVAGNDGECRSSDDSRTWLRRAKLSAHAFAAQHRTLVAAPDGAQINLDESPLLRLASSRGAEPPFLDRHHVEAGERVRRLVERAQLQPRVTMSYSAARIAGERSGAAAEISDLAADARKRVSEIHQVLPQDCAGVVLDVCGLLKGLQQVEQERGWPRRSAKLVLRIGLEHLARHYGFSARAVGPSRVRGRSWREDGARPHLLE